jgi:hypothetical protein
MIRTLTAALFFLLLDSPADSLETPPPTLKSRTGPSNLAPMCMRLGFKVTEKPDRASTIAWEKTRFGMLEKSSFFLKSKFPSALGKDHFYRFTIWSESFSDSGQARTRLDSMHVMPPKLSIEAQYVYGLRNGYRIGSRVVFVQTDVAAYSAKVDQLTIALLKLESIGEPGLRNRALDSLSEALRKPDKKPI